MIIIRDASIFWKTIVDFPEYLVRIRERACITAKNNVTKTVKKFVK